MRLHKVKHTQFKIIRIIFGINNCHWVDGKPAIFFLSPIELTNVSKLMGKQPYDVALSTFKPQRHLHPPIRVIAEIISSDGKVVRMRPSIEVRMRRREPRFNKEAPHPQITINLSYNGLYVV